MSHTIPTTTSTLNLAALTAAEIIGKLASAGEFTRAISPKLGARWGLSDLSTRDMQSLDSVKELLTVLAREKWGGVLLRTDYPSVAVKDVVRALGQGIIAQVEYDCRALTQVGENTTGTPEQRLQQLSRYRTTQVENLSVVAPLVGLAMKLGVIQDVQLVRAHKAMADLRAICSTPELEQAYGVVFAYLLRKGLARHAINVVR